MPTPTIFFDEAGNTGAALIDPEQPVFVLASVDFTPEESAALLSTVQTRQATEAKFSALRKSAAGRQRLLDFLRSPLLTPHRAKTMVMHKRFMVVAKFVDILEETLAHASGLDIYELGANIAISNLHYYVSPILCGQERFDEFLASFVDMIRTPAKATKHRFFSAARAIYRNCSNEDYRSSFAPYIYAERFIDHILEDVNYRSLDPAIPSFFVHCTEWGAQIGGPFHAIHDASKPMAAERTTFEAMMDLSIESTIIGYDRRKFGFPLRATGIDFADSKGHFSLQVADLLAGATNYYASCVSRQIKDDFALSLEEVGIQRFVINALWPSTDVTPEALGTVEAGGINAVDHIANALRKSRI